MIERPPFTPTRDQEERDKDKTRVFSIRLNDQELKDLEEGAKFIHQEKLTTALKSLASIGIERIKELVTHEPSTRLIIKTINGNNKRNDKLGILEVQPKFKRL